MRCVFAVSMVALVSSVAFAQPAWFDQDSASQRIRAIQEASGVPAISAAVMRLDGDGVGTAVSGIRKFGEAAAVTAADRFHMGSNSKAFTAQIAARAVDAGQISWDTTIDSVFGNDIAIDPSYSGVTLRQLLTHQAGTPQFGTLEDWLPLNSLTGTPTEQRLTMATQVLSQPRAIAAGAGPFERYSNAGVSIAAAMVERVTGRAWESMVGQTFNSGMGLNVHVGAPGADGSAQPFGHVVVNGQLLTLGPGDPLHLPSAMAPAGDLNMTMTDLAEFGRQHLRAVEGLANTLDLSPSSVATLHDTSYAGGPFGMGWFDIVDQTVGLHGFGHDGSTDAFTSILYVDTVQGLAIAVAMNGSLTGDMNANGSALAEALLAMRDSVIPAPGSLLLFGAGFARVARRRR